MNKDIKNLISEAFEELYQEMVNGGPQFVSEMRIKDADIKGLYQNALKYGTAVPTNFDGEDIAESRNNFDKIIDALVMEYRRTGNPNAKSAIQLSYAPKQGSKMFKAIAGPFVNNPIIQDAAQSAYEQIVIDAFDKTIERYKPGTSGIGAMFTNLMRERVKNYMIGYDNTGKKRDKTLSLDKQVGDNGGTFADRLSDKLSADSENPLGKEGKLTKSMEILDTALNLLYNSFDEDGNAKGKRNTFILQQLINKKSPEEVFEMVNNNPEFPKISRVSLISQEIKDLFGQRPGVSKDMFNKVQEINDIVSKVYNIPFDLSNIDYAEHLKKSSLKKQNYAAKGHTQDEEGNIYKPQYTKSSAEEYKELTGDPYWEAYKKLNLDVLMERVLKRIYKK